MKLIIPCNVIIKRFYRTYAEVDENATDEDIRKAMIEAILEHQDAELTEDPQIDIEEGDIVNMEIDHDNEWTEYEEKEIQRIFNY